MTVALDDMEEQITNDGLVTKMPQGEYEIERAHPLLSAYNAMVKNYNSCLKQIADLIRDTGTETAGQALMNFISTPRAPIKAKQS